MKIFLADGRLGNQIFQYLFLKNIKIKNEKIFTLGFEALLDVFYIDDVVNFNKKNKWIRNFFIRVIQPVLLFLSERKIISSVKVNYDFPIEGFRREITTYSTSIGLLKKITYVYLGFFQSEEFFNKNDAYKLKIKKEYVEEAKSFLKSIPATKHKVFIHIRRGDYKRYTVYGKGTLLPMSYFKDRIQWFNENKEKVFFIFLSDEPKFIAKEFSFLHNKLISFNAHMGVDLAIMSQCDSAILSPSSFGWWGSYLMQERKIIFVPKYWSGFNSKIECPLGIAPSYGFDGDIQKISI